MASTDLVVTVTANATPKLTESWRKLSLAVVLSILVIFTVCSNLVVLISLYTEKKLRTVFNCFVANLAVTDFLVGLTAIPFFTLHTVLGYWPLGQVFCGL